MCTYFKEDTDTTQNLIDDILSNFDCQKTFPQEDFKLKKYGGTGLISEEKKQNLCLQNFTKKQKQPPVVILQQAFFYNVIILCFWLRTTERSE